VNRLEVLFIGMRQHVVKNKCNGGNKSSQNWMEEWGLCLCWLWKLMESQKE